jgi:predicted dehydrogenase
VSLDLVARAPAFEPGVGPLRPVRVAIVGLGRMGTAHAAVLSMLPGVTLAGVVDAAPAAARRLHGMGFRAPVLPTLDALLAGPSVDAVWVCTPPDSHLPIARHCVEAGVAVFVEKPLAHTLDDARALAALGAGRVPIACGYTLAFWPSFAAAHALLAAGVIGTPVRARSSMFLSQVTGPRRGWTYDRARAGGGVVANLSSHLLFVLRAYFGMPERVRATWRSVHTAVEDEVTATLAMPGGVDVAFASSWCVPGYPISSTRIEIEGTDGRLAVDDQGLAVDLDAPRGGFPAGRTALGEPDLPEPAPFFFNGEAYALEDAHVLRWATGGPTPPVTAAAGYDVQRIMTALYASAAADGASTEVPS